MKIENLCLKPQSAPYRPAHSIALEGLLHLRSEAQGARSLFFLIYVLLTTMVFRVCLADEPAQPAATNSFPTLPEVLQGHTFADPFERDVFFLRTIHSRYASHWPELLAANINVEEYVRSPDKMLRFTTELDTAMHERNDPAASASLAVVTSDSRFYTNADAYHPEILRAAAQALISIGPEGRKALASSFTESHYREDAGSLEELAKVIGEQRPSDLELAKALAATAFEFSTTNGGSYPRCTTETVKNLLRLPEGASTVRSHLKSEEMFSNPGRFQAPHRGGGARRRRRRLSPTAAAAAAAAAASST